MTGPERLEPFNLILPCAACGHRTCRLEIFPTTDGPTPGWRFVYEGIEAGNGDGDDIGAEEAGVLIAAFTEPLSHERVHGAGLYDDAGYCRECDLPYCREHWSPSSTGFGRCPRGRGESLDPRWSPDDSWDQ